MTNALGGKWAGALGYLALAFAVAFNLYHLYPEVAVRVPYANDGTLHIIALERTIEAFAAGEDPTDHWLPSIVLGYPLFHHYQHLAYLGPAIAYLLLPLSQSTIRVSDVYAWSGYLLLSLFRLSIYRSMRRFGFPHLTAVLGAMASSLISTNGSYGLDFSSYVWRGYGLYTQLWAMVLLPPALAQGYVVLREGSGFFWAAVLLGDGAVPSGHRLHCVRLVGPLRFPAAASWLRSDLPQLKEHPAVDLGGRHQPAGDGPRLFRGRPRRRRGASASTGLHEYR